MSVVTLTLSSQQNVECKSTWDEDNMFGNETCFHKWGKLQENEPNDSQSGFPTLRVTFLRES
jgi:hypothetical protein